MSERVNVMITLKVTMGFVLIMAGSQLHWFFAAVAGFLLGEFLSRQAGITISEWNILLNGLKYGALNGILAVILKPMAMLVSAFLIGGYIVITLPALLAPNAAPLPWWAILIGGILAFLILLLFYSFGAILLSTLAGAVLVTTSANFIFVDKDLLVLFLVIMGMISQFILLRYFEPRLD